MSEDYLAQKHPIAKWNSVRGVWEKPGTENLFCEHWALFSETWPTAGTMRNGEVFELPTQAPPTTVSESSLLRSPTASQGEGGALGEDEARKRGNTVGIRDNAMDLAALNGHKVTRVSLPTPTVADQFTANLNSTQQKDGSLHSVSLAQVFHRKDLFPTPTSRDHKDGQAEHIRKDKVQVDTIARAVFNSGEVLLPTTRTSMKNGASAKEVAAGNPKFRLEAVTNWGRFEPAIRRWEEILGRPAPDPTKPDGKDGAHRLSSAFTEWMMGVPEGWITDAGLTRNEELKACGNGVVPQQAELALRMLIGDDF